MKNKKKTKIVYGVDDIIWVDFVYYCKKANRHVGEILSEVLQVFIKQKNEEGIKGGKDGKSSKPRV